MNVNNDDAGGSPAGPESWVARAIAQQEEHIKRTKSCGGRVGRAHTWVDRERPAAELALPDKTWVLSWSECAVCEVTKTDEDYLVKMGEGS